MKVYSNKLADELMKQFDVVKALSTRERSISRKLYIAFMCQMVGLAVCAGLGLLFDHEIFKVSLPAAAISVTIIMLSTMEKIRLKVLLERVDAELKLHEKSQELSEYNSDRLLELMAVHEVIEMSKADDLGELRIIN